MKWKERFLARAVSLTAFWHRKREIDPCIVCGARHPAVVHSPGHQRLMR